MTFFFPYNENVSEGDEFSVYIPNLSSGVTYIYRAYSQNLAGSYKGSPRKFTNDQSMFWWADAADLGGGWKSNWIGDFIPQPNHWSYHFDFGWIYVSPKKIEGIWLWSNNFGWCWTSSEIWPFMWSSNSTDWLYLIKGKSRSYIFDYFTESFITDF